MPSVEEEPRKPREHGPEQDSGGREEGERHEHPGNLEVVARLQGGDRSPRPSHRSGAGPASRRDGLSLFRGGIRSGGSGPPERGPRHPCSEPVDRLRERGRGAVLHDRDSRRREESRRSGRRAQFDGESRRRPLHLARAAHVRRVGWNGTLALWSAVCLVAALLWLTVDVDAAASDGRTSSAVA